MEEARNLFALGLDFFKQEKFISAEEAFEKALIRSPDRLSILVNLSATLIQLGKWEKCKDLCLKILTIDPADIDGLINLSICLSRESYKTEALALLNKATSIEPSSVQAWANKGNIYLELDRLNESFECFEKALKLNPISQEAFIGRGNLHNEIKEYDLAIQDFNRALQINPDNHQANWNKSLSLLRLGNFKEGWNLFESRWSIPGIKEYRRNFSAPLWLGKESLENKTILIHAEQGYGDTIQFCRYIPLIESMGATVLFLIPRSLSQLMKSLSPTVQIIEDDHPNLEKLSQKIDFHCPVMSLALAFGTTLDSIPVHTPYLSTDPLKHDAWFNALKKISSGLMASTKPYRIGITWNGSGHYAGVKNSKRDIPKNLISDLISHLQTDNIEFHSLQIEKWKNDEMHSLIKGHFFCHHENLKDFSDTAALMGNLDLIVSVDTAVAHLAGALKLPTFMLTPDPPDFMSLVKHQISPWYQTVSLLRQSKKGDWSTPLDFIRTEIEQRSLYGK